MSLKSQFFSPGLITVVHRAGNPDTGLGFHVTYEGTEAEMLAIAENYEIAGIGAPIGYGYKTQLSHPSRQKTRLVVQIPDSILYTESWQLSSAPLQIPIWRDEKIREYVPAMFALDLSTQSGLQAYLYRTGLIMKAVNCIRSSMSFGSLTGMFDFTTTPPPAGAADLGAVTVKEMDLIFMIAREGEYTDWMRPVLKRRRHMPNANFASRTRLVGRPELYSLDGIANAFGIPDDRYDQAVTVYDDLPAAVPNTVWAWKLGRNDSEGVVGAAKDLECLEWTFGLWSTIKNTFIE